MSNSFVSINQLKRCHLFNCYSSRFHSFFSTFISWVRLNDSERSIIDVLATLPGHYGCNNNNNKNNKSNDDDNKSIEISVMGILKKANCRCRLRFNLSTIESATRLLPSINSDRIPVGSLPVHFNRASRASVSIRRSRRRFICIFNCSNFLSLSLSLSLPLLCRNV